MPASPPTKSTITKTKSTRPTDLESNTRDKKPETKKLHQHTNLPKSLENIFEKSTQVKVTNFPASPTRPPARPRARPPSQKQAKAGAASLLQKFKFLAGSSCQTNQKSDRQITGPSYNLIGQRQHLQARPRISAILILDQTNML